MRTGMRSLGLALLIAALAAPLQAQQLYVYPSKGQTPEQQAKDTQECQGWAVQQAGSPYAAGQQPSGGVLRGAAGGAMIGVVGGAIAGDAGQGAAIGAATGALFGGIRQHRQRQQQYNQQQYQADAYNRALAACLQGRGYTVN